MIDEFKGDKFVIDTHANGTYFLYRSDNLSLHNDMTKEELLDLKKAVCDAIDKIYKEK